jgi:hypothetical protein
MFRNGNSGSKTPISRVVPQRGLLRAGERRIATTRAHERERDRGQGTNGPDRGLRLDV